MTARSECGAIPIRPCGSARRWPRELLTSLPKAVDFSEKSAGEGVEAGTANFAAPAGTQVDPARLALHNKALDYQRTHAGVDYLTAVKAVS